jgi:hypothetical protein
MIQRWSPRLGRSFLSNKFEEGPTHVTTVESRVTPDVCGVLLIHSPRDTLWRSQPTVPPRGCLVDLE